MENIKTIEQPKIRCLFGLHSYEIHKEEDFTDARGNVIGKMIINRCKYCGKIDGTKIPLTTNW